MNNHKIQKKVKIKLHRGNVEQVWIKCNQYRFICLEDLREYQSNIAIMEFGIPLTKDDLLKNRSGQYYVKELTPLRAVNGALDGNWKT